MAFAQPLTPLLLLNVILHLILKHFINNYIIKRKFLDKDRSITQRLIL